MNSRRSLGKKPPTGQPSAFFQDHAQHAPLTTRNINKLHERHLGKWNKLFSDNETLSMNTQITENSLNSKGAASRTLVFGGS